MKDTVRTRRLIGALVAAAAFGLGIAAGAMLCARQRQPATLTFAATDAMPAELLGLGLSDDQRARLGPILVRGRDRILRIVDRFTPAVQAGLDSTDDEIRTILTGAQRVKFDSLRAANPPLRRVIRDR